MNNGVTTSRVLLRSLGSGQYYTSSNAWSGAGSAAHDFETVDNAAQFARAQGLAGMEVVLRFDDPANDLVLPLSRDGWASAESEWHPGAGAGLAKRTRFNIAVAAPTQ
jgi:hypothetical protein